MNTQSDKYWKWLIIVLVIYNLISLFQYLPSVKPMPDQAIRAEQRQILNADSLDSATEAKVRFAIDSTVKATKTRQIQERIVYKYIKIKDDQLERDYYAGKSTADSVISSKNNRIAQAETLLVRSDSLRAADSLKIGSYVREIEGKNVAIGQLSATIDGAVGEIERLQKKIGRKNKVIKAGAGIITALGVLVAVK